MRSKASGISPQPWPWSGQPRVLIEHADESAGLELATTLREAGFAVAVCPGPEPSERCPLTGSAGCAVADGADAIVSNLGTERPETTEVMLQLHAQYPNTPLVVGVAPEDVVVAVRRALAASQPATRE